MALGFPMNQMGLKPGAHTLGIKVRKVAPETDPFLRIAIQENKAGEMVDTSAAGAPTPPFPILLAGDQLKAGAKRTFTFTSP